MTTLSSEQRLRAGGYTAALAVQSPTHVRGLLKQKFYEGDETLVFGIEQQLVFHDVAKKLSAAPQSKALAPRYAPVRAILKLQAFWDLTDIEIATMCGLVLEDEQSVAQSLAQHLDFPDIKTRLRSLMAIRSRLSALFNGNQVAERQWLRTPWARLHGETPLTQLTENDISALLAVESKVRELVGG